MTANESAIDLGGERLGRLRRFVWRLIEKAARRYGYVVQVTRAHPDRLEDIDVSWNCNGEDVNCTIEMLEDDDPVKVAWDSLSLDEQVELVALHSYSIKDMMAEGTHHMEVLSIALEAENGLYADLRKKAKGEPCPS